jgi:phosphatidylserine/phosphatidylglycerophosphate/cardiolipin synthase-like enzyme
MIHTVLRQLLTRLSDAQIHALAKGCGGCERPPGDLGKLVAGGTPAAHEAIGRLVAAWQSQPALTGDGVAAALEVGLEARREADSRRSRCVWTGPGAAGDQRLTAAVLHELIAAARERVLLVSYAAHTLAEVAADLQAAVARGCDVAVVFETEEDSAGAYSGPKSHPFQGIEGIRRWRWPPDRRVKGAVLHAKLLAVDGRQALVGSANLTHRALTANLEVGVLVRDPVVVAQLEDHVHGLMEGGVLVGDGS